MNVIINIIIHWCVLEQRYNILKKLRLIKRYVNVSKIRDKKKNYVLSCFRKQFKDHTGLLKLARQMNIL